MEVDEVSRGVRSSRLNLFNTIIFFLLCEHSRLVVFRQKDTWVMTAPTPGCYGKHVEQQMHNV